MATATIPLNDPAAMEEFAQRLMTQSAGKDDKFSQHNRDAAKLLQTLAQAQAQAPLG